MKTLTLLILLLPIYAFGQCPGVGGSQIDNHYADSLSLFEDGVFLTIPGGDWQLPITYHTRVVTASLGGQTITDTFSIRNNHAAGFFFPNLNYGVGSFQGVTLTQVLVGWSDTLYCPTVSGGVLVADPFEQP